MLMSASGSARTLADASLAGMELSWVVGGGLNDGSGKRLSFLEMIDGLVFFDNFSEWLLATGAKASLML